jgi:type IV pilus assembly protein PilY1
MTVLHRSTKRLLAHLLATICCVLISASASAQSGDDRFLLQSAVAPNVVLFMDNSDSMNQIEWHPAFDPEKVPDASYCTFSSDIPEFGGVLDPNHTYVDTQDRLNVDCDTPNRGNRTVYFVQHPDDTLWDGRYLMWYLGLDENDATDAAILSEIATATADVAGCTQAGASKFFAEKYRRTRFEASKQVLLDLLCVAETKNVRFAQAEFRVPADMAVPPVDPNGGFLASDLGRSNPNHAAELESAIKNSVTTPTDGTPLAETLFQIYTYWMPRDGSIPTTPADMPVGLDGTPFPIYVYNKFGNPVAANNWLEDAMQYDCEKAFVIIVTDGLPSRDDFDSDPATTSLGFANFGTGGLAGLIGNYHTDAEVEEPGAADEATYYLDDIAKYMYDKDFRPDLAGTQTIDTYTVGFSTDTATDDYLTRTATLGNGTFYKVKDGDQLTDALIAALNDIIEKSASFTAATVPSARTADGADFYQSFFFPRGKSAFWEGHIRAWQIDALGAVRDKNGACALDDPTAGECNSGPFLPTAVFFWDAGEEIPLPASRNLYVSKSGVASGSLPPAFTQANISYTDLGLSAFMAAPDPFPNSPLYAINGSTATTEEGLADEIVAHARGCFFGTGVSTNVATPLACAERPARLGDIFHSNAVAIRKPSLRFADPGYSAFKSFYSSRSRVLYAGSNAGFLEAIDTGTWVVVSDPDDPRTPPFYSRGTGVELFGFMPWQARKTIRNLTIDSPTDRRHYVDGDVNSADVWIDAQIPGQLGYNVSPTDGTEWHTYLLGALREGGNHYYALDVTNPPGNFPPGDISPNPPAVVSTPLDGGNTDFPRYAWEFPSESNVADQAFMGETWSKPIITKVRLKRTDIAGQTVDRWVAIVTGGYDATSDPNPIEVTGLAGSTYSAASVKGRGIYIIDLKTGGVIAEKKFGSVADPQASMLYSVVSTPSVLDLNFDSVADVIYVGDMGGNVWKWLIHNPGEDRINDGSGLRTQPSWPFKAFFTAAPATIGGGVNAVTYYKNFMFPPAAAYFNNKLYLAFGSGERRDLPFAGDPDATELGENNRFYVMIDSDPYEIASPALATITESDLTDFSGSASAQSFTNKGYYIRVADGEKFVTNVEIFAGRVIAATFTPTTGSNPCTNRGDGNLYVFDAQTGEGHFSDGAGGSERGLSLGPGLPTDPKISIGVGGKDNRVVIEKSGSDIEIIDAPDVDLNGATLFWREND